MGTRVRRVGYQASGNNAIPNIVRRKMSYNEVFNLTLSTGGLNVTYTWNLANIFDPRAATGGHQPYGYDQLSGLYREYCVVHARIQCKFFNRDVFNDKYVGMIVQKHPGGINSDPLTMMESKRGPTAILRRHNAESLDPTKSLSINVDLVKFNNARPFTDQESWNTINADPVDENKVPCTVWAGNPGAEDGGLVKVYVLITYDVLFKDPNIQEGS